MTKPKHNPLYATYLKLGHLSIRKKPAAQSQKDMDASPFVSDEYLAAMVRCYQKDRNLLSVLLELQAYRRKAHDRT
jgi:hypothetical protein